MFERMRALFGRAPSQQDAADVEKSAAPLIYPTIKGGIPSNWGWGWWQQGKDPLTGAGTSVVSACTDAYAQTAAALPVNHYATDEDGIKTLVRTSAASRVVMRPNEYQTRSDFYLNLIKSLLMRGNAYAVGLRNDRNEIAEMHLLSHSTQPYVDPETKEIFYAAGENPLIKEPDMINYLIPARDICHIRLHCPRHPLVGVTPIENAVDSIVANSAITSQQARFFNNMARPSGVLSTDLKLTKDQMMQLRAAWEEQSKDMNTGGIPILGSGMKWEQMSISSQDAQMIDAFHMTVEDVARAFRVPLPLINDNRHSTYNNVEQLISMWLSGGLGFLIDHIENSLDRFFNLPANAVLEFDTDRLLRTDFAGRVDGFTKAIQHALMSPNEARAKFSGLPPVKDGDKPIVQQQMVPLGWTQNQPKPEPAPAVEPDVDEDAERGATIHYLKKAMNSG